MIWLFSSAEELDSVRSPWIVDSSSSSTSVTAVSTTCALAPGRVVETEMIGGSMSGSSRTDSRVYPMTPNSTRAALIMMASTGRPMATSESFMPQWVLSEGYPLHRIDERGAAKSTELPARMETHGNAARFHVASKANRAPGTLQGLCASRLIGPVRMNGIERGAQPLHMVTATDGSPARQGGARAMGALALLALSACLSNPPGVRGVAGTAPAPNVLWTPPRERHPRDTTAATPPPALPIYLAQRVQALTLPDIVALALRRNTATAAAWADARAAAAPSGAARGQYFPPLPADLTAPAVKTAATAGRVSVQQQLYGPTLNASWLLFDFGTRSGSVAGAREALLAADWTHNAVIQNVVLQVETAYFEYHATKALLAAQQTTVKEAQTNLEAAEQRHRVGLATIADVLQAKTARSQAQLALETVEGTLQTTRGALALAMGLPANVPYDVELPPDTTPPLGITDSLDALIDRAVRARPDLMAARATAQAAQSRVAVARGQALPSLVVSGTGSGTYFFRRPLATQQGNSYSATIGLQIPLFSGWSQIYDVRAASAVARAADERRQGVEQQVIFQVFNSFYAVRTATQRVRTSDDLLASATQSEQVALGRYRAGAGSLLDLLTAQAVLADARAQVIDARLAWYSALAQLGHDTGILGLDGQNGLHLQTDSTGPNR